MREYWNTHFIRRSRYNTISGRPDVLYELPAICGGENGLIGVAAVDLVCAEDQIHTSDNENEYKDYFEYLMTAVPLHQPENWEDALCLFKTLIVIAENGL